MKLLNIFNLLSVFFLLGVGAVPTPESASTNDVIGDVLNFLGVGLVNHINVTITLDSLTTNLVSINFDVKNPLLLELTLDRVSSKSGVNNTVYAEFDHVFDPPFVVPILATKNSGKIDNVLLTQGALNSLPIIDLGYQDLLETNVSIRAATINGKLGIPLSISGLKQSKVPTNYTLAV